MDKKKPREFALKMIEILEGLSIRPERITQSDTLDELQRELIKEMMERSYKSKTPKNIKELFPVIPNTYFNLFQLLQLPLSKWKVFQGVHLKEQDVDGLTILDSEDGITEDARELLSFDTSWKEYQGLPVLKALKYCREQKSKGKDYQKAYVNFRTFLIRNPLIVNSRAISDTLESLQYDEVLMQLLHECYEEFDTHNHLHQCQSCGWTMRKKGREDFSCVKKICQDKRDLPSLHTYSIKDKGYTMRVLEAIQTSTVIPGLGEYELAKKMEKKGYKVTMYPNLEWWGDLMAEKDGEIIYIDCKDYVNPLDLVETLRQKNDYPVSMLIAVPDKHLKNKKNYIKIIENELIKDGIYINIKKFSEVAK